MMRAAMLFTLGSGVALAWAWAAPWPPVRDVEFGVRVEGAAHVIAAGLTWDECLHAWGGSEPGAFCRTTGR